MTLLHPQLAAFAAVLEEGSFGAAARRLVVTPSAISQRIKALEDRLGQVLVVRETPCRPTWAGKSLLRRLQPMQMLEAEALADFLPQTDAGVQRPIAIAVNDDSLHTWFLGALAQLHRQFGHVFDIHVDDQDHTLEMLRDGLVLGAVTAEPRPLQGCNVQGLGTMRYQAIASPNFAARHFGAVLDASALAQAPVIVFNHKDELEWRFMRSITRARLAPPIHYLPTSLGFVEAAALGLGWCVAPEAQIAQALRKKQIIMLDPSHCVDVPLYWQHAAVRSVTLERITRALCATAAAALQATAANRAE